MLSQTLYSTEHRHSILLTDKHKMIESNNSAMFSKYLSKKYQQMIPTQDSTLRSRIIVFSLFSPFFSFFLFLLSFSLFSFFSFFLFLFFRTPIRPVLSKSSKFRPLKILCQMSKTVANHVNEMDASITTLSCCEIRATEHSNTAREKPGENHCLQRSKTGTELSLRSVNLLIQKTV